MEYVFHYAAQPGVRTSIENPLKPHEVNATGILNILQACLNSNVKKLIHAHPQSGGAEYTWANIDKARGELDWKPNTALAQGLDSRQIG